MHWLLLTAPLLLACSFAREQKPLRAEVNSTDLPPSAPAPASATALPSDAYVEVKVGGVAQLGEGHAMLLVDETSRRFIPVFLGGTEGLSIALRLSERRYPRPLTHDLLDSVLKELGARVHSARVVKLEGDVYFGMLVLEHQGRLLQLDARTSDAVAMAVGNEVPIFVARRVLAQAGTSLDRVEPMPLTEPIPTGVPL